MLVRLLVDNVKTSSSANLSDLLLLDNITGLTVRDSGGNRTADGFQAFGKKFLEGRAELEVTEQGHGVKQGLTVYTCMVSLHSIGIPRRGSRSTHTNTEVESRGTPGRAVPRLSKMRTEFVL